MFLVSFLGLCRFSLSLTLGGYHGYWAQDFFSINKHFGTKEDLHFLVDACHKRNMWIMVDVVLNHVAPVGFDFSSIVPFDRSEHYHDCVPCPENCMINFDLNNQTQVRSLSPSLLISLSLFHSSLYLDLSISSHHAD